MFFHHGPSSIKGLNTSFSHPHACLTGADSLPPSQLSFLVLTSLLLITGLVADVSRNMESLCFDHFD